MNMDQQPCGAPLSKLWSETLHALPPSLFCFAADRDGTHLLWTSAATRRPNLSKFALTIWKFMMTSPTLKATTTSSSLSAQLQQIGLRALPAQVDDFLARASKSRWSPLQILEQ